MNIADLATLVSGHPAGLTVTAAALIAAARRWLRRVMRLVVLVGIAVVVVVLVGLWHAEPAPPKPPEMGEYR
ncbi:hypothetical protein ACAG26_14840 [Mycobacterium sp. pUA109]|uniref:hypothetical protein n=1 Tax=Mycobacterium sp. pUA109 TaxID=3238982 RepID=UPI00351B0C0F